MKETQPPRWFPFFVLSLALFELPLALLSAADYSCASDVSARVPRNVSFEISLASLLFPHWLHATLMWGNRQVVVSSVLRMGLVEGRLV